MSYPKPCENAFRACTPAELHDWIADPGGGLDRANLSLALEILGAHGPEHAWLIAGYLTFEYPIVREGALLGLRAVINYMAEHDESPTIRRVATRLRLGEV